MIVNRTELADILGVSLSTIDARIKKGLPFESKGREGRSYEFDTAKVINWTIEQIKEQHSNKVPLSDSFSEAKRRKLNAEAKKAEIELAKELGLVVMLDDVLPSFNEALMSLRTQLLNLPRRLTPLLLGETDEDVAKDVIEKEIDLILTEAQERIQVGLEDEENETNK